MRVANLLQQLRHALAANDVNACCALLRRVYCEVTPSSVDDDDGNEHAAAAAASAARTHATTASSTTLHTLLSSLQRRVVACGVAQLQHTPRRLPHHSSDSSSSSGGGGGGRTAHNIHASSVDVLCYTAHKIGDWVAALACADYLPHSPSPLFLSALLRPGNTQALLQHCERRGWAVDVANAMRVLAMTHGSWTSALAVAHAAERQCVFGEVYSLGVLVPHLAASGAYAQATALFDAGIAHGALVDAALVQHLLLQSATLRQWRLCLHMLHALHTTRETAQLLPRTAPLLFRRLLEASPSWSVSLAVLQHARACDLAPDATSLSMVLAQCDAAGAWAAATAVYEQAVRDGHVRRAATAAAAAAATDAVTAVTTTTAHAPPSPPWRALVHALTTRQAWQQALQALSWMSKARDASTTAGLAAVIESCAQAGEWQMALMVGKQLLRGVMTGDGDDNDDADNKDDTTTTTTSSSNSRSSNKSDVTSDNGGRARGGRDADVASSPPPLLQCTARTRLALLQACAQGAQWQPALRLFRAQLRDVRVPLHPLALCTTLQATAAAARWGDAVALLAEARAARPRVVVPPLAHRLVLKTCVQCAQWQAALDVLAAMRDDGVPRDRQCQHIAAHALQWRGS